MTLEDTWQQIVVGLGSPSDGVPVSDANIAEQLAEILRGFDTPIALVLDNLDVLPDEVLRSFALELRRFRNFKGFADLHDRISCVFFGAVKLLFLAEGRESPLQTIVRTFLLEDLDSSEAALALQEQCGCDRLGEEARSVLYAQTGGHQWLVKVLGERLCKNGAAPSSITAPAINESALEWSYRCAEMQGDADPCFGHAVEFLECESTAYQVLLDVLENQPQPNLLPLEAGCVRMCGALTVTDERVEFRGEMFRSALSLYMDDLRKADYWCLHGGWSEAQAFYERVSPAAIRERRETMHHDSRRSIMDLYLGITTDAFDIDTLEQAAQLVTRSAAFFFGADEAVLWRLDVPSELERLAAEGQPQDTPAACVQTYPIGIESSRTSPLAGAAARRHAVLTLSGNLGVVVGVGDASASTLWALQLTYRSGVPAQWVRQSLQYVRSSVSMILERAKQREEEAKREHARFRLIHEISLQLPRLSDPKDVFRRIVDGVSQTLAYDCAQLSLVYPNERLIRAVDASGVFKEIEAETVRSVDSDDILALVVRTRKPINDGDCRAPDSSCERSTVERSGIRSLLAIPLLDGDEAIGVLQVGDKELAAFDRTDVEILTILANSAAVAIRIVRQRAVLEHAMDSSGRAMAVLDSKGTVASCNMAYEQFFTVQPGDPTPLRTSEGRPDAALVKLAFDRDQIINVVREHSGRRFAAIAVSLRDDFQRFAGGIEVIDTQSPMHGLNHSLHEMHQLTRLHELHAEIVHCVCRYLGYSRARLYVSNEEGTQLTSKCQVGLRDDRKARFFAEGRWVLHRNQSGQAGDGFECVRLDAPIVIVRRTLSETQVEPRQCYTDDEARQVIALDDEDLYFLEQLEKADVAEWIDVPLGTSGSLVGKLSVDLKDDPVRRLGFEDLEILALFARWATSALDHLAAFERARTEAEIFRQIQRVGETSGPEALAWDFMLNSTLHGGTEFNRVAVFLMQADSERIAGFTCHGAASRQEWECDVVQLRHVDDRRTFIESERRRKLAGLSADEKRRQDQLRKLVLLPSDRANPFVQSISKRATIGVVEPRKVLLHFYESLGWPPPMSAVVCPLVYESQCEGVVYVDRAYTDRPITAQDRQQLEAMCFQLAAIARPLRLTEQLQSKLGAYAHNTTTPIASVIALAEGLQGGLGERHKKRLDLILAESHRCEDMLRRLSLIGTWDRASSDSYTPSKIDIVQVLKERLAAYEVLMEAEGIAVDISIPDGPILTLGSSRYLGDVIAELGMNALNAIKLGESPGSFSVRCVPNSSPGHVEVLVENSGPTVPQALRDTIFDRFVSRTSSTGLGLWISRQIVARHGGTIAYSVNDARRSEIRVVLPLCT